MILQCLQHVPFEGPAAIGEWAARRGHEIRSIRFYAGEALPEHSAFDAVVVMGGPMGTYDEAEFSWLKPEKQFLREAIARGIPVLGVCLGAQLLAEAIGGKVFPGPEKEIGWFPVRSTGENGYFPPEFVPLHWHGDTFELPSRAELLASSEAYPAQAFTYGPRCLGLQFHLELRPEDVRALARESGTLPPGRFVEPVESILGDVNRFSSAIRLLEQVLDRFFAGVKERNDL